MIVLAKKNLTIKMVDAVLLQGASKHFNGKEGQEKAEMFS